MPHSDIHKKKLKKNWTLLAMIFLWCALIWGVTMIKIARADSLFIETRLPHQEQILARTEQWHDDYSQKAPLREQEWDKQEQGRIQRPVTNARHENVWMDNWQNQANERLIQQEQRNQNRLDHTNSLADKPQQWWNDWNTRQQAKSE